MPLKKSKYAQNDNPRFWYSNEILEKSAMAIQIV